MLAPLVVTFTLTVGQAGEPAAARLLPPVESVAGVAPVRAALGHAVPACDAACRRHGKDCQIDCLRPWTCEDLKLKPFEPKPRYCGCKGLFFCPPEKKNGDKGNGNEKDKDKEDKEDNSKDADKKNGNDEEKKEDAKKEEDRAKTPLMQILECRWPVKYERMKHRGDNLYGWIQQGFTANTDSPRDRVNYGVNFNWRSNDYRLNQVYLVYENTLEHDGKPNIGYRVDFIAGHDTPFLVANGLFDAFTGFDPTSGFGVAGPASFRQMNRVGIDLPQFYAEVNLPHVLTDKGIDIRAGQFYTLLGREVYPGKDTDFYSRTFENVVGTAYTHTGVLTTLHVGDTLQLINGIVRGWDVFEDNNDACTYHGGVIWNSCDKRWNWTTAYTVGPEQFNNNDNYRTVITSYVTRQFGRCSQWKVAVGGLLGWEANAAVDPVTGSLNDAEWYDASVHLFYTVDPRLILGFRAEWFRDDDGTRTAFFNRPGYAASFYDVTVGLTYKPYQNLRVRPELRFDWTPDARPYNDQRDRFMITAAFDLIWEF